MNGRNERLPAVPLQGEGRALCLILASASPRRVALLKQAGIEPAQIIAPEVDETPKKAELPRTYALRMAVAKAEAVARVIFHPPLEGGSNREAVRGEEIVTPPPSPKFSARDRSLKISTLPQGEDGNVVVLAADTVVALGRRILPKAETDQQVSDCLRMLSGRRHMVMTALALAVPGKKMRTRVVATRVAFKVLTDREVADYVVRGEGIGKAGGYAIQGRAEAFVRFINGSYSNVVGLPLYETVAMIGAPLLPR